MNPVVSGALREARINVRIQLFSWSGLSWISWPAAGLLILYFLRDTPVMESSLSVARMGSPGLIAMYLIFGGVFGIAFALMTEQEDGTLLRAKTIPGGMAAHLLGNVITYSAVALLPVVVILAGSSLAIGGVTPTDLRGWALFVCVCLLGLTATMPAGAILGSIAKGPITLGLINMVIMGSLAISGVYYPISAMPSWLQWLGQILPTYWIGLGLRAAILPPEFAAMEVHGSWQTGLVVVVLLVWSAAGVAFAPMALRRLARRQSGSTVAAARERVLAQGY